MKYLSKKWIFVSFLPLLAACETEPKNPNSFEYFKWHNQNYQWGQDKYGDNLSLDECKFKLASSNKDIIKNSEVYLDELLRTRMFEKVRKNSKNVDTYLVYFPLEADFYPLPYDIELKLNVIRWDGKVDCGYRYVFDGIMIVKSIQKMGDE